MNAIKTLLQEHKIKFSPKRWEPNDWMIGIELKQIAEHEDCFLQVMNKVDLTQFREIGDYLNYLFVKKLNYLDTYANAIDKNEEAKKKVEHVCNVATGLLQKLNKRALLSFFNGHYREIFSIPHDIAAFVCEEVMEDIVRFQNGGISPEVFIFLLEEHPVWLRWCFDNLRKKFEKNPTWFEKLCAGEVKETRGDLLSFITHYSPIFVSIWGKKDSSLRQCVEETVEAVVEQVRYFVDEVLSEANEDVALTMFLVTKGDLLLKGLKLPYSVVEASQLQALKTRYYASSNPFWKTVSVTICEDEAVQEVEKLAKYPNKCSRVLLVTHRFQPLESNAGLRMWSSFDGNPQEVANPILDSLSNMDPADDYFTFSVQMWLHISLVHIRIFALLILREAQWMNDIMETQREMLYFLHQKVGLPVELVTDGVVLEGMMRAINFGDDARNAIQPSCYGAAMFVCAMIEKLLREVWKILDGGKHEVPQGAAALRTLLEDSSGLFQNVFGEHHRRKLAYFLCNVGEKSNIGLGLRNRFAHWDGIEASALMSGMVAFLYYLYQDVLNTLFVHFYTQKDCCTKE